MITKIRIQGYRIYGDFTLRPNKYLNILVGGNDAGKSTLMEAIGLALNGRIGGRSAQEELHPYWFNKELVDKFLENCAGVKTRASQKSQSSYSWQIDQNCNFSAVLSTATERPTPAQEFPSKSFPTLSTRKS